MPAFKKKLLSLFFRTRCQRQLHLYLYNDGERKDLGMPSRQTARAAIGLVAEAGYDWQDKKVNELEEIFGAENILINEEYRADKNRKSRKLGKLELESYINRLTPFQFIIEARYDADTPIFRESVGFDTLTDSNGKPLSIGEVYPDIIQTLPSRKSGILLFEQNIPEYHLAVEPDGSLSSIDEDDDRLRLRVIDIKLTSEPGANYFAEVVYYSMTLSAWLKTKELDSRYVVVATPAVWPGSLEDSFLSKRQREWKRQGYEPTLLELASSLEKDIEIAPVDAHVPTLQRLLKEQLPAILNTPWNELPFHVNYTCQGCEFLGYPWERDGKVDNDPNHCWPTAEKCNHLSLITGLSAGAANFLSKRTNINNIVSLATVGLSPDIEHQTLRTKGDLFLHRSLSLQSGKCSVVPNSFSSATMPGWTNLHLFIFVDYDLASSITVSIGLRGFWKEPLPYGSKLESHKKSWNDKEGFQEIYLVDDNKSLTREREEFLKFLRNLKKIMREVSEQDKEDCKENRRDDRTQNSSYQIYLWDEAQQRHLMRLIGRHLSAIITDTELQDLAWLFPSSELLAIPEYSSRKSPITLISPIIQNTIAAPVPHHYTLLEIYKHYNDSEEKYKKKVNRLFYDPLSDLIPSERVYEYWTRKGDWNKTNQNIAETTKAKLYALLSITLKLEHDLKTLLPDHKLTAPEINFSSSSLNGVSIQGLLWYEFTRLNVALQFLETHITNAMPYREKEARFKSAILSRRLEGAERKRAIDELIVKTGNKFLSKENILIYEMSPNSVNVNFRDGDIGFALSPMGDKNFLNRNVYSRLTRNTEIQVNRKATIGESGLTEVSIITIDRLNRIIALKIDSQNRIAELEEDGSLDLSENVILDRINKDYLTDKLSLVIQAIGRPSSAVDNQRIINALNSKIVKPTKASKETFCSRILWDTKSIHEQRTERCTSSYRETLEKFAYFLNESQWNAWENALTRHFSLIWGPPGTGKTWTLRLIILAIILEAVLKNSPLRILITSGTYTAIDNILLELPEMLYTLSDVIPDNSFSIYRLQNDFRPVPEKVLCSNKIIHIPFSKHYTSDAIIQLQNELGNPCTISIIGVPPQQLHNLAYASKKKAGIARKNSMRNWFDFVIFDEASQTDIATSTLVFSKIANNGTLVLAGDDLQLPPIHEAEAPDDLEHLVGSVYNYFRYYQEIEPIPLDTNYRANATLVSFTRSAGYDASLKSHSEDLSLKFFSPLPTTQPDDWPDNLFWTDEWNLLLNPAYPATCFVYEDELSSQVNDFEADSIAALCKILYGHLNRDLENEKSFEGMLKLTNNLPHDSISFWSSAIGIVTPHRAQQAKIIYRLQEIFSDHNADKIRNAIDTVERFQGQERQIIFGSFGLGDFDLIRSEDEFIYNLNRFNVLASRARAKLIIFITRSLVEYLSNNADVVRESKLIKHYVEIFCSNQRSLHLAYIRDGAIDYRPGVMRYR
jgi:uncharacterized protein YaiE (UPF0345 family)